MAQTVPFDAYLGVSKSGQAIGATIYQLDGTTVYAAFSTAGWMDGAARQHGEYDSAEHSRLQPVVPSMHCWIQHRNVFVTSNVTIVTTDTGNTMDNFTAYAVGAEGQYGNLNQY